LTKNQVALDGIPDLDFRRIGLDGGRLTEAQKPLKKKNCLSTEKQSFDFGLWHPKNLEASHQTPTRVFFF
jgi:hypothetical protein